MISARLGCRFADRADHVTARRDPDLGRLLEAEGAVVQGAAWWVCRARVGHGLVHGAGVKRAKRSSSSAGKTGLPSGPARSGRVTRWVAGGVGSRWQRGDASYRPSGVRRGAG